MTTLPGCLCLSLAVAGIVVATATSVAVQSPPRPTPLPPVDREAVGLCTCRGEVPPDHVARAEREPAGPGEPLSVAQDPPVLFATQQGPVRLREVLIAGDVPAVRFWRNNPTGDDVLETWARTGTKLVGTRMASVFSPEWSTEVFRAVLASSATGVDYPVLYWGAIELPGDPARWRAVYLRLASGGLPVSRVTRINERVQFASHVVNLVVPEFWWSRAEGGLDEVDLRGPARVFYEHFADVYDLLAFVGEPSLFLDDGYGAWHRNVRNEVLGINAAVMDNSRLYGSERVLQGVEVYRDALATTFRLANHELSHQWGHYFDWMQLAGLARQWPKSVHAPLASPGQSLIGAELPPTLRVSRGWGGAFEIERTPSPIEAGPFELYAMGLLAAADLPEVTVFNDQAQIEEGRTPLQLGAPIQGGGRVVTSSDLIRVHGPRTGPRPGTLRRALVVVSRDGLVTQREMDYWNYFAARLEDPNGTGPASYEGYVAFDRAARRAVDLQTRVLPRHVPAIDQPLDVDYPPFSVGDCPAVQFAQPVGTHHRVGDRITISGTVVARDRSDFQQIGIRFWPYGGDAAKRMIEFGDLSASGGFSMQFEFRDTQAGRYCMEVFLFWPDAPAQYARCTLTPVTVSPAH